MRRWRLRWKRCPVAPFMVVMKTLRISIRKISFRIFILVLGVMIHWHSLLVQNLVVVPPLEECFNKVRN